VGDQAREGARKQKTARITKPAVALRLEAMARASVPTGPVRKRAQSAFAPETRHPEVR